MREILFRGKREDNGKWVEGYLSETTICSVTNTYVAFVIYKKPKGVYDTEWHEVIPETVGQYTGLTDKNGEKIFEGDILERKHKKLFNHSQKMIVEFIPFESCFSAVDIDGGNVTFISDYINDKYSLKVIDNIHDNPELLKEAE